MDRDLAGLLGLDLQDPLVSREVEAAERDMRLIETLVRVRKALGLTQSEVAERMGRTQPAVSDFERLGGDPHLSTIRRYALAVGANVHHVVSMHSGGRTANTTSASAGSVSFEESGAGRDTRAAAGARIEIAGMA